MSGAIDDIGSAMGDAIERALCNFRRSTPPQQPRVSNSKLKPQGHTKGPSDWGQFVEFDDDGNIAPVLPSPKPKTRRKPLKLVKRRPSSQLEETAKSLRTFRRDFWRTISSCSAPTQPDEPVLTRCMHCSQVLSLDQATDHWCVPTATAALAESDSDEECLPQPPAAAPTPHDHHRPHSESNDSSSLDPWEALARDKLLVIDGAVPHETRSRSSSTGKRDGEYTSHAVLENEASPSNDPWLALERTSRLSDSTQPTHKPQNPQATPVQTPACSDSLSSSEETASPPPTTSNPPKSLMMRKNDSLDDILFYCNM